MIVPYTPEESTVITLFETNSDAVVISNGVEAWNLGPVTPDMEDTFAADARAWEAGEWQPNEVDGQTPTTTDDLTPVATYENGVVSLSVVEDALGGGARVYLGEASKTTTYERTTDEGTDTIRITVTGDEVRRVFFTDGTQTSEDYDRTERLHDYLVDIEADGYHKV